MTRVPAGASVWEAQLYEHLTTHEEHERELLIEYQQAAAESGSPAFAYLVSLIVEDEVRHHRIFQELAQSVEADVEPSGGPAAVPRLGPWGPDAARLVEVTERLLDHERQDRATLRALRRELADVADTTLWDLLVALMQADTDKHLRILEFVRNHAQPRH